MHKSVQVHLQNIIVFIFLSCTALYSNAQNLGNCGRSDLSFEINIKSCKFIIEDPASSKDKVARAAMILGGYIRLSDGPATEVLDYYLISLEKGNEIASARIGHLYMDGYKNIAQDYKKALDYFQMSPNNWDSVTGIGLIYLKGLGVKQDKKRGLRNLVLAATFYEGAIPFLMSQLCEIYQNKEYDVIDLPKASMWCALAVEYESRPTTKGYFEITRTDLIKKMSLPEIERGKKLLSLCKLNARGKGLYVCDDIIFD